MAWISTLGIAIGETRRTCVTQEPLYDILHNSFNLSDQIQPDLPLFPFILTTIILSLYHPQRYVILRRLLILHGVAIAIRGILITLTALPDPHSVCRNRIKEYKIQNILLRSLNLIYSLHHGEMTCCDLIVSGHTIVYAAGIQIIWRYFSTPFYLLRIIFIFIATIGVFLLLLSKMHYSIDIVVALLVVQIVWQNYHLYLPFSSSTTIEKSKIKYTKKTIWEWWEIQGQVKVKYLDLQHTICFILIGTLFFFITRVPNIYI